MLCAALRHSDDHKGMHETHINHKHHGVGAFNFYCTWAHTTLNVHATPHRHAARCTTTTPICCSLRYPSHYDHQVLIANRGEIALRVQKACAELGLATVAVYSDADLCAPFVRSACEAVFIGAAPALASYLNQDAVIQAAKQSGADAIHPGMLGDEKKEG